MSALLETTATPPIHLRIRSGFHLRMASLYLLILLATSVACWLSSLRIQGLGSMLLGVLFASAVVFVVAVFWHEQGKDNLRDAVLTVPWTLALVATLPWLVLATARLDLPLRDARLARLDQSLGISVPAIVSWASHHWLGRWINRTYPLLSPLLTVAVLLPAMLGKVRQAELFVMSNLVAFLIGIPLFALVPAIGPWYGCHFAATPGQLECQAGILLFRAPGHLVSHLGAIICFPSFHVIWAILAVPALWGFSLLRIPVALLSAMIVISTVTTGWHYVTDVLGGMAVAAAALAITTVCLDRSSTREAR